MALATVRAYAPGILASGALAALAFGLSRVLPLDAVLLALVLGLAAGALARHPPVTERGTKWLLKTGLEAGIVLVGIEVNLAFLVAAGPGLLVTVLILVPLSLVVCLWLSRFLKLDDHAGALIGMGTGICGLSAIAAAGATLRSPKDDIAVAAASIGVLSALGLILYPLVGVLLDMPDAVYGAWSGLSLHALANAVGAGFAVSPEAGRVATVAKLARISLLAPMLLFVAYLVRRRAPEGERAAPLVPWTVWGFLLMVAIVTFVPLPEPLLAAGKVALRVVLLVTIAALGYGTRLGSLRQAGPRGLALAVAGWVFLAATSLVAARLLYS